MIKTYMDMTIYFSTLICTTDVAGEFVNPVSNKSRLPFCSTGLVQLLIIVLFGHLASLIDSQKWTHSFDINGLQNQLNDRGIAFVPFSTNPVQCVLYF